MKLFKHDIIDIPKCILDESNNRHTYKTPDDVKLNSVTGMLSATKSDEDRINLNSWRDSIGHSVADYILRLSSKIGKKAETNPGGSGGNKIKMGDGGSLEIKKKKGDGLR